MQLSDLEHFRDILLERRQNLSDWLNSPRSIRTGEMKKASRILIEIRDALDRIKDETYGKCEVCCGEIELHRLETQPISQVCLDCISPEEKTALEEDLFLASKIHRALLPQSVPKIPGFDVNVRSIAASNIGGDYFDFLSGSDSRTFRVVIGDVMGHGLPAGLLMSNVQGALRILSSDIEEPGKLITRLNEWLCRNIPVTKFMSMVCLNIERTSDKESKLTYTNAGHCFPYLIRNDGSCEQLEVTGGVIGVDESFTFDERSLTLYSGDMLVLYTDGIIEAVNSFGETYNEQRLIQLINDCRENKKVETVESVIKSVLDFTENERAEDDLTVLTLIKN